MSSRSHSSSGRRVPKAEMGEEREGARMVSVRVERKRRCWESRRGWRVASSGNKSEREGEGEGKKKKNKKTSTSFLSTSRVYRVYPLEQRPGNLIPFSIYLNPLTQTRSSSTSGPPSFHSLSRPSLTLPLFPQVPPLFRLVSSNPPFALTSFLFGIAQRKETDSFFFLLQPLLSSVQLFSSSSTFHYWSEFPFLLLLTAIVNSR